MADNWREPANNPPPLFIDLSIPTYFSLQPMTEIVPWPNTRTTKRLNPHTTWHTLPDMAPLWTSYGKPNGDDNFLSATFSTASPIPLVPVTPAWSTTPPPSLPLPPPTKRKTRRGHRGKAKRSPSAGVTPHGPSTAPPPLHSAPVPPHTSAAPTPAEEAAAHLNVAWCTCSACTTDFPKKAMLNQAVVRRASSQPTLTLEQPFRRFAISGTFALDEMRKINKTTRRICKRAGSESLAAICWPTADMQCRAFTTRIQARSCTRSSTSPSATVAPSPGVPSKIFALPLARSAVSSEVAGWVPS